MPRLRADLDFLVTAGLLAAVAATGLTGVIADLWDLNDFWWHTVAGYVMGALAIAHVLLNVGRFSAYARFRLRTLQERRAAADTPSALGRGAEPARAVERARIDRSPPIPARPVRSVGGRLFSRRGLFGAVVGGLGGYVLGRGLRPLPPIEAGSDVGVIYHEWSKPGIVDALGTVANWGRQPELYKAYPAAPRIALPAPVLDGGPAATVMIANRRSTRTFADEPLTPVELSTLLALGGGITADRFGLARRAAPSSGALYPIELYPVVHRVEGIDPGAYHYAVREQALERVRGGDQRSRVVMQGLMQEFLGECGVVVFLTQILQRMRFKYQDRSYRYGLLEAGHIGENLYLAARALGLGACGVGAFLDDDINDLLGVDGTEEAVVYLVAVGRTA